MRIRRPILACALAVLTAASGSVAAAQVPFLGGTVKRLAYQAAAKQLAPAVTAASPIDLDWNQLYPTVDMPPGGPFHSSGNRRKLREQYRYIVAQMAKSPNAPVNLRPGDYVFFMRAYCTHAGPQGIPAHPTEPWPERFQLAPLHGRRASILPALYARGQQHHVSYQQTQFVVWSVTNGVPYAQMPPEQQALFTKLVPQYKGLMAGDPVQSVRDRWQAMRRKMPLLPALDAALDKMGAVGTTVRSLEDAQRATIANANDFEQSKATLAPRTVMTPAPVAAKSWSKMSDRVYAKIKLPQNYHGIGSVVAVLVRVLPATASTQRPAQGFAPNAGARAAAISVWNDRGIVERLAAFIDAVPGTASIARLAAAAARRVDQIASTYDDMANQVPAGDWGNWIGMPSQPNTQPLTFQPTDVTVGPATTGDGSSSNGPQPGQLGDDYLNNGIKWWNETFNGTGTGTDPTTFSGQSVQLTGSDPAQDRGPIIFTPGASPPK